MIARIADRNEIPACEVCGSDMHRDIQAEQCSTPLKAFFKPIEMYSLAPDTPEQYRDLKRKCPHIQFNDQLVPLATCRQEKKDLMKAVGNVELS